MKSIVILFLMLNVSFFFAQEEVPTEVLNGRYHLLFPERDAENKTKLIQFDENNGAKLLAIAACEKCMPAIYSYQESDSKQLSVPVFFNSTGLYVIAYGKDSFINVLATNKLGDKAWVQFVFSNFYSKNRATVNSMTKEKIETYARLDIYCNLSCFTLKAAMLLRNLFVVTMEVDLTAINSA